jgi:hypothetical protein
MERSRRGEGNDHTSQPLPPVGKADQRLTTELPVPGAAAEDLSDLEDLDTPTIPGYLTLEELDVSDFQGVAPEAELLLPRQTGRCTDLRTLRHRAWSSLSCANQRGRRYQAT